MSTDKYNIINGARYNLRYVSMFILATLPILGWYEIPFPVGLGYAIVLFLSAYTIFIYNFRLNVLPVTFWMVFFYVCFMWMYHYGVEFSTLFPPGGWPFFMFFLVLVWGVKTFDLELLKKFMGWVVYTSVILFWIQIILQLMFGHNVISFVPNLTGSFKYEGMSYSDLVYAQLNSESGRPCSIFLEPSYMAYYLVVYLTIVWFSKKNQDKLINKEILLLIITLIALRSGSGMLGLGVDVIVKLYRYFKNSSAVKRIKYILFLVPLLLGAIYFYADSGMGQSVLSRSTELSTDGTSGFSRVVKGYLYFASLNQKEKLTGIPSPEKKFGIVKGDGKIKFYVNGFQTVLLTLGYMGAILYILFYTSLFRKVSIPSRMCIIVLLIMSLIESNYLNSYMMLLTVIPCAEYFYNKKNRHETGLYH